jgi:membrane protein
MLLGSSIVFAMLKNALNTMWGVKQVSIGFVKSIRQRIISYIVVLLFIFVLFLLMILSSLLAALKIYLSGSSFILIIVIEIGDIVFSLVTVTFIFVMLYKFLSDVNISWNDVWVGAAITAILFTLGKIFLGSYICRSSVSSAYGAAGSLMVILLWVYYSALIIFAGAEFTQVYA